jgi:hypothetical protein
MTRLHLPETTPGLPPASNGRDLPAPGVHAAVAHIQHIAAGELYHHLTAPAGRAAGRTRRWHSVLFAALQRPSGGYAAFIDTGG